MVEKKEDSVSAKIRQTLNKHKIIVVITKSQTYHTVSAAILKELTNVRKLKGVYVTFNVPYINLKEFHKKSDIRSESLFFIDAIGKISKECKDDKMCHFVEGPTALTELSYTLNEITKSNKIDFWFFDSISSLLTYNGNDTATRFLHYLVNKAREHGTYSVFVSTDDEKSNQLLPIISQFSDKCLNV